MIKWEQWMEIKDLKNQGHSIRAIERMTGHSRKTIRKILKQSQPAAFFKPERGSKLDQFKEYAKKRYEECALSAVRLIQEIRPMGYAGSIQTLRRYLQQFRQTRRAIARATVRFETAPGAQAQVDWGYCGQFANSIGQLMRVYVFVMVLGFSRMLYVRFTSSMKLPVLIDCHLAAFRYFGGWTRSLLFDNMKQVRLGADRWNPLFIDFANHYGIVPKTCRPRWPRTKGKVERMVDYAKDNFLNGRTFVDFDDLNAQGLHWLDHTANVRIHNTTGKRPVDLLAAENLVPYNSAPLYQMALRAIRKVDCESFVHFDRSRYWVPPENVGKSVLVCSRNGQITIHCNDLIIAEHAVADKPGSCVAQPDQLAEIWKFTLNRSKEPVPHWDLTFDQSVATHPLAGYEEAVR